MTVPSAYRRLSERPCHEVDRRDLGRLLLISKDTFDVMAFRCRPGEAGHNLAGERCHRASFHGAGMASAAIIRRPQKRHHAVKSNGGITVSVSASR